MQFNSNWQNKEMASKLCRNAVRWTGCLEWKKGCNLFKKTSWPLLFLLFSSMHHAGKKMRGCIKRVPLVTYYFTFIFPGSHLAPCHHHVTHTHQHLPTQMSKHRKKFIPPCLALPSSEPACLWELRNRKGTESSLATIDFTSLKPRCFKRPIDQLDFKLW